MSSALSLVMQSLGEQTGLTEKTEDQVYTYLETQVHTLDTFHEDISMSMAQYTQKLSEFLLASQDMHKKFAKHYTDEEHPMSAVVKESEKQIGATINAKIPLFDKIAHEKLLARVATYKGQLESKHQLMRDREAARLKFDHYRSKIMTLRQQKDAALKRGKKFDMDRYSRNEAKFGEAQAEYSRCNQNVTNELEVFWTSRYQFLDMVFAEFVKTESFFLAAVVENMDRNRAAMVKAARASAGKKRPLKLPQAPAPEKKEEPQWGANPAPAANPFDAPGADPFGAPAGGAWNAPSTPQAAAQSDPFGYGGQQQAQPAAPAANPFYAPGGFGAAPAASQDFLSWD